MGKKYMEHLKKSPLPREMPLKAAKEEVIYE
jgi:hypothetical protein